MKTEWKIFEGSNDSWDEKVNHSSQPSYLNKSSWANYLNSQGWTVSRFISFDEKKKEAYCIQGFTKRYFSYIGIIWFPNFNTSNESNGDDLIKLIKDKLNFKIFYIRLRSHIQKNNFEIINPPFGKVKNPIDSSKTMILNLENSKEKMYENLSKNWRRNLNRSKKLDYEIVDVLDAKIISQLYKNFENLKGISSLFTYSQIKNLILSYKKNILVIGARYKGEIHAIRGALVIDDHAIDIFAVTNEYARKNYFSYQLCWNLLNRSKNLGCVSYDLNGVEPEKNIGVYNFKKGTGAELVETIGEFEYSSNYAFKKIVNFYINKKYRKS